MSSLKGQRPCKILLPRVLVDLDEVCADCLGAWLEELEITHNLSIDKSQITSWDFRDKLNLTEEEYREPLKRPGFYQNLSLIPGARREISRMIKKGWEIVFVTVAPYYAPTSANEKWGWIKRHFPKVDSRNVIFTERKDLIRGTVLIDDGPTNLENFPGLKYVYDRPHNQHINGDLRIPDWDHLPENFYSMIEEYFKKYDI